MESFLNLWIITPSIEQFSGHSGADFLRKVPVFGFAFAPFVSRRDLVLQRSLQDGRLALPGPVQLFRGCSENDLRPGGTEELIGEQSLLADPVF
jgi:hypothetical protein